MIISLNKIKTFSSLQKLVKINVSIRFYPTGTGISRVILNTVKKCLPLVSRRDLNIWNKTNAKIYARRNVRKLS